MKLIKRVQSLVGKKSSKDEQAPTGKTKVTGTPQKKPNSHYFVLQTLEALKNLEHGGGTFICSSPDFKCYFKKKYMPLFEQKNVYIKVAFDRANNVTDVCGLLPRIQHEQDRGKIEDEKITLSKMPDCLLAQAIAEVSRAPASNISGTRNFAHQGGTASTQRQTDKAENVSHRGQAESTRQQKSKTRDTAYHGHEVPMRQQRSNVVADPNFSIGSLKGAEKDWLNSMKDSLIDIEFQTLLHLLQHTIISRGFHQRIEHFLNTRQELEPGKCSTVIRSFEYLAREFQFSEHTLSVARIGSSLQRRFDLKPKEIFSTIVELFFCLGYDKEIKGYTTGFIELTLN